MGAGLYYHSLFGAVKQTNLVIFAGGWGGQSAWSSLSIVLEPEVKHLGIASIDRRTNEICVYTMGIPFEVGAGSFFEVPALLSLMKTTFNDQGLNMPCPHGMEMSSPFDVAALTQCLLFSPMFLLIHARIHCHCQSTAWYKGHLAQECQH